MPKNWEGWSDEALTEAPSAAGEGASWVELARKAVGSAECLLRQIAEPLIDAAFELVQVGVDILDRLGSRLGVASLWRVGDGRGPVAVAEARAGVANFDANFRQRTSGPATIAPVIQRIGWIIGAAAALALLACSPTRGQQTTATPFGTLHGVPVHLYALTNAHGLVAKITDYGATVTELHVPDRNGRFSDVVLGFDSLDDYRKGGPYFGAIVGRVANRIRNAEFTLQGKRFTLAANDPPNHLHGGRQGWDKVVWSATPADSAEGPALALTYVSKDGEEGYPGTVRARVIYTLTNNNELKIEMTATTDQTTLVNMAHHGYWNLGGHDAGTILDHQLTLFADQYTPGDPMVPTGVVASVKGTPFDFTQQKAVGADLRRAGGTPVGFDHNFIVNGDPHALRRVARVKDPKSGRVMSVSADQPGVQFYTGNFLDGSLKGKGGAVYAQYTGLCLETQKFPNAINVPAWRDQVILSPGQTYRHVMLYSFSAE